MAFAAVAAASLVGWLVWWAVKPQPEPDLFDAADFSLTWVDHAGRRISERPGQLVLVLDPFAFYRNAPSRETASFTIDPLGYRGGVLRTSADQPLLLVTGGSAAFGYGLEGDSKILTAYLARKMPQWAVANSGVVGYLSGQELASYVHRGSRLAPRRVVSFGGWNDLIVPLVYGEHCSSSEKLDYGHNWSVLCTFEERLRLFTEGRVGAAEPSVRGGHQEQEPSEVKRRALDAYVANIESMALLARASGAEFLAVFQPQLGTKRTPVGKEQVLRASWQGRAHFDPLYEQFLKEAEERLGKLDIRVLNVNSAAAFRDSREVLFVDSVHLSARGNEVAAELIAASLEVGR